MGRKLLPVSVEVWGTELISNTENHSDLCDEKIFRRCVLLVYVLIAAANVITHEMWRDELHVWFAAADSNSVRELFSNMRCQGHPPLWYLMLYVISRATHNPAAMKALHLAIAIGSVYVFVRFAPFTRLQRLLFVFGYFPLYEYAAISRNYAVGIFLLFCFCAACGAARKNFFILCIILFLLGMASAYSFIITVCLLVAIGFKAATDAYARDVLIRRKWAILLSAAVVVLGLVISAAVMFPESDCMYASEWTTGFDIVTLEQTFATAWQGLAPIPQITHSFWNTNIVPWQIPQDILAVALLCFFLLSMANNRTVFLFFSLTVGAMLVFEYIVYIGSLRHFGHFFIVAIVCLWLEKVWGDDKPIKPGLLSALPRLCIQKRQLLIVVLLCIHFAVGIFASVMEWRYPFSQGKNAARYIRESGMDNMPIVGYMDFAASSVAGYLDRPFYYPNSDKLGKFVVFDTQRRISMGPAEVLENAWQLAEKEKSDVLLVLNMELGGKYDSIAEIKRFTGSIQGDEEFYLYLLKYRRQ